MLSHTQTQPDISVAEHHSDTKVIEAHAENVDLEKNTFNIEGAMIAEATEAQMTFKEAIRDYPSAVFWSFAISLCIIMEGYDTALPVCIAA